MRRDHLNAVVGGKIDANDLILDIVQLRNTSAQSHVQMTSAVL